MWPQASQRSHLHWLLLHALRLWHRHLHSSSRAPAFLPACLRLPLPLPPLLTLSPPASLAASAFPFLHLILMALRARCHRAESSLAAAAAMIVCVSVLLSVEAYDDGWNSAHATYYGGADASGTQGTSRGC